MLKKIIKDKLTVKIFENRAEAGKDAARDGANAIRELLAKQEWVNIIFAAAPSQNDTLAALFQEPDIDWSLFVTYLTILFGELVPKRIGMSASSRVAKLLARPMYWLSIIASPFVWLLAKSTSLIFRLLNINTNAEKVTEEEIKSMIDEGTESGEVQEVEQDIVDRVFSLGDRNVSTIMTHRNDIISIDIDMTNTEIFQVVCEHLYQVYPITRDRTLDDIVGVVYLKDLFGKIQETGFNLREVIRPAQYFHENMDVYKALDQIRQTHIKYGLIISGL